MMTLIQVSHVWFVSLQEQKHQVGGKPRTAPVSLPSMPADISSPPQMYSRSRRGGSDPSPAESLPSPARASAPALAHTGPQPLGLARVQEVMSRVLLLQEDVDEFVGRKTDKSYRCLEELLTKELLVLDSVETGGQEVVRQARKEAVQRIQAILDRLEKKAF